MTFNLFLPKLSIFISQEKIDVKLTTIYVKAKQKCPVLLWSKSSLSSSFDEGRDYILSMDAIINQALLISCAKYLYLGKFLSLLLCPEKINAMYNQGYQPEDTKP